MPPAADPAYAEPAVRRRYVDFLRICGLLCPAGR
jgi:hypothetical protein